jgi:amidohydrolase
LNTLVLAEETMTIEELWRKLHACPEASGQEKETKRILQEYLEAETDLEVKEEGPYLFGVHEEHAPVTVGVRADMDAIRRPDGRLFHGCGHDGHMAMACGAARRISGQKLGKNVVFLFQPAEEDGQGARMCFPLFEKRHIDILLGLHNIPGFPLGQILLSAGTFADASLGLSILFHGRQSHAAYPEDGANPAGAMASLIGDFPWMEHSRLFQGKVMITVICVRLGEENFGISAGEGKLDLTLRAENTRDLQELKNRVLNKAQEYAENNGITLASGEQDVFPATVNQAQDSEFVLQALRAQGQDARMLGEPMRWSEDFGQYSQKVNTFFFGLGSGEDHAGLHTEGYVFPEALIARGSEVWDTMIRLFPLKRE